MRWAILVGFVLLSGCNTPAGYDVRGGKLCKLGVDGRCYHIGDRWEMYRLDKDYKPIRVYPREVKEKVNG